MGLEVAHHTVGPAFEGIHIVIELPVQADHFPRAVIDGGLLGKGVPLPHRYGPVIVVGAYEYYYGIHILPVLGFQFFGLTYNLVHPVAADAVHIRLYAQNLLKVIPIDIIGRAYLPLVSNGVPEECNPAALPLARDEFLGQSKNRTKSRKGQ